MGTSGHNARLYWIGFNLVRGIGSVRFKALLDYFGDPAIAWQAPADALAQAGLSQKIIENLQQVRDQVSLEKVWERMQSQHIQALTWEDEAYPRYLKEIDQPPPVLYVRGSLEPEDDWSVAIVGTRRCTAYGRQVAEELAGQLASGGLTIVSGLARGVDAVAHQAALNAGGRTIAVLGSGVDHIYPPEHRRLAEEIILRGALVSDYAPGTGPDSANFPPRNRIISGLSRATVVVEAGESSGALITATFAAEQGREVFAVPGNINAPQSKGTNQLIQKGASPLLRAQDVFDALNLQRLPEQRSARLALPTDALEAQLYQALGSQPVHIDELHAQTNIPMAQVSAALTLMELKGLVRQTGNMHYIALHETQERYG